MGSNPTLSAKNIAFIFRWELYFSLDWDSNPRLFSGAFRYLRIRLLRQLESKQQRKVFVLNLSRYRVHAINELHPIC